MSKKSQITLVIAMAVFIFLVAALIFYISYYYKSKNPVEPLAFERAAIESYINSCVKKTAEEGLKSLGKKGLVSGANSKIAPIESLQNELSSHVNNNLDICLRDFEDFRKQGWNVEKNSHDAKAQINEQDVSFEVAYPLRVSSKENTLNFERFFAKVDVRLKLIYEALSRIAEFKFKYKREVDLTELSSYDLEFTVFPDRNSFVYVIDDKKSLIMNEPYRFRLAIAEE